MNDRCPIHTSWNKDCPVCIEWLRSNPPPRISMEDVPFFTQPSYPQYRKVVGVGANGETEYACLDGTETDDTVIVKYDHSPEYKKFREMVMTEAMKQQSK